MIERLFLAGTDVFRLNLSHRGPGLLETARHIRKIEAKYDHPIGILADLQGPKHRVGSFDEKVELKAGQRFRFDLDDVNGEVVLLRWGDHDPAHPGDPLLV